MSFPDPIVVLVFFLFVPFSFLLWDGSWGEIFLFLFHFALFMGFLDRLSVLVIYYFLHIV